MNLISVVSFVSGALETLKTDFCIKSLLRLFHYLFELFQEYTDLKEKHQRLLKVCLEQEKTLEEVGSRLRDSKLEADNLK